jgi:hypothetical protein
MAKPLNPPVQRAAHRDDVHCLFGLRWRSCLGLLLQLLLLLCDLSRPPTRMEGRIKTVLGVLISPALCYDCCDPCT